MARRPTKHVGFYGIPPISGYSSRSSIMAYFTPKTMNDWLEKYRKQMDSRYPTFKIAFDLLFQLPSRNIVETGCVRQETDWGAGYSTMLFGEFCQLYGGHITSVDLVPRHLEIARELTKQFNSLITYVESDSVAFLQRYTLPIDLLYLDSMDVPIHEGADRTPCQEHSLNEFKAAELKLHRQSIVLVDDYFDGDGKGRLTEQYMMAKGWRRVMAHQQQLFIQ
jgi:hypothetical protein